MEVILVVNFISYLSLIQKTIDPNRSQAIIYLAYEVVYLNLTILPQIQDEILILSEGALQAILEGLTYQAR